MRLFEFTSSETGLDLSNSIDAELDKISNLIDQNPGIEGKINTELDKIISQAKAAIDLDTIDKEENPTSVNDQEFKEASTGQSNFESKRAEIFSMLPKMSPKEERALLKKLKELSDPGRVMSDLSEELKTILSKRTDIAVGVRQIFIKELFDYIRLNPNDASLVSDFLNDCASGNGPIDLPEIISREGSGDLVDKSNPYRQILLKLAKTNPGSGNAASGQGEWMLVLAGKNTKKITPGDIQTGNDRIEVKSSDSRGKSFTDFVLSSDKLPVAQAKDFFVGSINKILKRNAIGSGTATEGGISALNEKTVSKYADIFREVNSKKPNAMQEIIKGLWKTVYKEPSLEPYINSVAAAVNEDGSLELSKLYAPTAVLAAAAYKIANRHDALLMLNIPDRSYTVVRDPEEMQNLFADGAVQLAMTSIFDFRSNPGAPTFVKRFKEATKK